MKKMTLFFAFLLIAATASFASAADDVARDHTFKAKLSGAEIPPVATKASGEATFRLSTEGMAGGGVSGEAGEKEAGGKAGGGVVGENILQYKLSVKDIENVSGAHIHMGKKTTAEGPVIAPLFSGPEKTGKFSGVLAEGTITDKDLIGPLRGKSVKDLVSMISSGDAYVNVHTKQHPSGEIRGEIE